jgi:hypothetical protein
MIEAIRFLKDSKERRYRTAKTDPMKRRRAEMRKKTLLVESAQ